MSEQPRKERGPISWVQERSRRFWIVVAALPLLYVASIGPWVWIGRHLPTSLQPWHALLTPAYSEPMDFVFEHAPTPVRQAMHEFVLMFTN